MKKKIAVLFTVCMAIAALSFGQNAKASRNLPNNGSTVNPNIERMKVVNQKIADDKAAKAANDNARQQKMKAAHQAAAANHPKVATPSNTNRPAPGKTEAVAKAPVPAQPARPATVARKPMPRPAKN